MTGYRARPVRHQGLHLLHRPRTVPPRPPCAPGRSTRDLSDHAGFLADLLDEAHGRLDGFGLSRAGMQTGMDADAIGIQGQVTVGRAGRFRAGRRGFHVGRGFRRFGRAFCHRRRMLVMVACAADQVRRFARTRIPRRCSRRRGKHHGRQDEACGQAQVRAGRADRPRVVLLDAGVHGVQLEPYGGFDADAGTRSASDLRHRASSRRRGRADELDDAIETRNRSPRSTTSSTTPTIRSTPVTRAACTPC